MKSWDEFTSKYPDVVEYIDIEATDNLMIACQFDNLENEKCTTNCEKK